MRHRFFAPLAFFCVAHMASVSTRAARPLQAGLDRFGGLNPISKVLNLDTVRAMLDAGENPDMRDRNSGATLLHYAALYNKPEIIVLLLAHNANVNAQIEAKGPETGATPLLYAVVRNELPVTRLLIARGADVRLTYRSGRTALHIAANGGMTDIVRLLLQNGADVDARDGAGSSPLDEAVRRGLPDVVSVLLESGARVNDVQWRTGATPLNEAAGNGRNAVLEVLFAHNADATIEDNAGFSPIENAIRFRHTDTTRIILQHVKAGLSKNSLGKFLEEAVLKGQEDTVEMLLGNGADLHTYLPSGSTALDLAALKGRDAIVRLLIAKGADVNSRSQSGTMPLHDAALSGHSATVAILLTHGAAINAQEAQSGTTALYAAASFGREDVTALLLEEGADPNICNADGESPLHVARANGHLTVADQIRRRGGRDLPEPL